MTSWLRELPSGSFVLDLDNHVAVIERAVWDTIDAYDCSIPTAPSDGRVYRQRSRYEGGYSRSPKINILRVVENDPDEPRYQLHLWYEALIV